MVRQPRQRRLSPIDPGSRIFAPGDNSQTLGCTDIATEAVQPSIDLTETSVGWAVDVTADGTKVVVAGQGAQCFIVVDVVTKLVSTKGTPSLQLIDGRFLSPSKGKPLAVERTMRWDATGYGAHTEKATNGAAPAWYFAEGSQGYFSTYLLLANPQSTANNATVTWLREGEPELVRTYPLDPSARKTIDASQDTELLNRSFGARIAFDQPGMAERAMYFGSNPVWLGGHAAAGATATSTHWYLAEGATGSYFTTFVLLANPGTLDAEVTLTYLPESAEPVTVTVPLAAGQRMTRNLASEHASLVSASVATSVSSTQPIVVERSLYSNANGVIWAAGTNATATALPEPQ